MVRDFRNLPTMRKKSIMKALLFLIFLSLISPLNMAVDTSEEDNAWATTSTSLQTAQNLIQKQRYKKAIGELMRLKKADQQNANIYNLLGYSHRKLQKFGPAYDYYQEALAINPNHKGANEYLGELYLQTHRLGEAKKQLAILEKICSKNCEEYQDLLADIKAYKEKP